MAELDAIQEIRENIINVNKNLEKFIELNDLKMLNIERSNKAEVKRLEEKIKGANDRIADLEETNKWMWRAIAGAFIGAAVASFIKF